MIFFLFSPPTDVQPIGQERSVRDPPLKAAGRTMPEEVRKEIETILLFYFCTSEFSLIIFFKASSHL